MPEDKKKIIEDEIASITIRIDYFNNELRKAEVVRDILKSRITSFDIDEELPF